MSKVLTHTFENGFRVIYQQSTQLHNTSIYAYCNIGSAYETDSVRGACHMIEHMCFQGTSLKSHSKDIFREYEKIGAYLNAFTEKKFTVFKVNCDILYVDKCIQVLSDIMLHSKFSKTNFYKEQKVVVEENFTFDNDLMNKMEELLFKGNSYAFPVDTLAYHPKVNSLKYELLQEWYRSYYVPSNIIFSVVSHLPFSKIIHILENTEFVEPGKQKSVPETALLSPILSNTFLMEPTYAIIHKKGEKTNNIMIGFRTCPYTSSDKYVLKLIDRMIAGPIGRLFTLLRDNHNITYGVRCYSENIEHMGYFIIKVETEYKHVINDGHHTDKTPGVLPFTIQFVQSIVKKGFRQEEIDHVKGYLYGKQRMNEDDIDVLADYNGKEWIHFNSPESTFCAGFTPFSKVYDTFIKPVTKKRVNDVVKKYFRLNNMVVGVLGDKVPSLDSVKSVCEKGWE